ncbi:MAG: hypothetical protein IJK60_11155 [Clostridia bacterium]|nr:hypothetical protein [Clostridia bacterium]
MTAIEPIYNDDSSYIKYVDLVENMIWCRKATFDGTPGIIIKWPCNIDIGDESFTESEFYYKFSGESWIYSLDDKVVFIKLGED